MSIRSILLKRTSRYMISKVFLAVRHCEGQYPRRILGTGSLSAKLNREPLPDAIDARRHLHDLQDAPILTEATGTPAQTGSKGSGTKPKPTRKSTPAAKVKQVAPKKKNAKTSTGDLPQSKKKTT